jgi:glycerol kinase
VSCILALDEGTTSARAIVFDADGAPLATALKEIDQIFPQPGWVEQNPQDIWASQSGVAVEALARAGLRARDVAAIGITNQRETAIVWDRATGEPVGNAIVWQDRRTAAMCDQLRASGAEPVIQERTGLLLDPYFSATKIAWILDHVPGARARAEAGELAFGTVDSWLVWKFSGGRLHVTDVSNASRTLLCDIRAGRWDEALLSLFRIPASMLPEIRSSSEVYGEVILGPGSGPPVAGIAGDQQAALFGQMCIAPGMTKSTYGTGCFLLQSTGEEPVPSRHRLLTTVAWKIGARTDYALEGSVFTGGAVVQWLRDGLGLIRTADEIEALAGSVADSGGAFLVPAFAGLGAPHWDAYARGAFVGLTGGITAAHMARAALESIAFQVADVVDAMRADSGVGVRELRVDGGAARNDLLMQFQADLLDVPVVRPVVTETTALGAAYLAGLAVGFWKSPEDIAGQWRVERRFEPRMPRSQVAALREGWSRAVERAKSWIEAPPNNP